MICHTIRHESLCPTQSTGVDDAPLVISSQHFYMFTFVFLFFIYTCMLCFLIYRVLRSERYARKSNSLSLYSNAMDFNDTPKNVKLGSILLFADTERNLEPMRTEDLKSLART